MCLLIINVSPWSRSKFNTGSTTVSSFMKRSPGPAYASFDEWIGHESIPFSLALPETFNSAADRVMASLRVETEDLMAELLSRRPEAVKAGGIGRYREAVQHLALARQLLSYHAAMARRSEKRTSELLGIRDAMMADNLAYAVSQERGRGRVLAFAHNSHLQMGRAEWQLGRELNVWWPAGSHLHEIFGAGYAVIGTAVGFSAAQGIGEPENGSLEAHLAAATGQSLLSTCKGRELAGGPVAAALKTCSKSQ